jgi:2-polyprenyl-3-methyl-5-hydroxy-6-metoxy-1,4-benzoquinol methylase
MELFGPHGRTRTWLRHKKFRLLTSIGRTLGNDVVENALTSRADLAGYLADLQSSVPQAQVVDTSVVTCDHRDWRAHFASRLQGAGLELGPLHRPITRHDGMRMTYVDYQDQATLQAAYPKLAKHIVPVDIIDDAQTLSTVAPGSFDFLISAHVLEHMRDPIGAVVNWLRPVRDGGLLYLIVPDKRRTFDKLRVRTTLEHMVLDYQQPSRERDFEHFLDYALFVHHAATDQAIAEATRLRDTEFSIHFHVFLPQDIVRLVQWIDGHVTPVSIVEGPVLSPAVDEFHLLLRRGAPR